MEHHAAHQRRDRLALHRVLRLQDPDLHITNRFDVLGGVRESANRQQFFESYSGDFIAIVKILEMQPGNTLTYGSSSTGHDFNYLITPRFKIDDNNMVYARFANGYRRAASTPARPGRAGHIHARTR